MTQESDAELNLEKPHPFKLYCTTQMYFHRTAWPDERSLLPRSVEGLLLHANRIKKKPHFLIKDKNITIHLQGVQVCLFYQTKISLISSLTHHKTHFVHTQQKQNETLLIHRMRFGNTVFIKERVALVQK